MLLSDLLIIFGPQLTKGKLEAMQELVYQAEASLQSQLAGFLMDRVFNHANAEGVGTGVGRWGCREGLYRVGNCVENLTVSGLRI